MPELLTGTVTFLFSDIAGSTRLLQAQGAAWPALLARHQELLRAAFAAHGGSEVGTEGDSFFVAFPTAPGAVAAAAAAQRALAEEPWPDGAEIRVRMGLHTGEASLSTDTYVGLHVHRASRITSVAHGGQVLLSDATRALLGPGLDDGLAVRDLGEHRLKDLDRSEHLFQLVIAGLANDFPPLASLGVVPNNLPTRLTTFLGREREIGEVLALLAEHRLLTLTGPGGTGKTRLSLEAAARDLERHPDGVWFVELASITEPELVATTIGQVMGITDRGGRPAVERVVDHVGEGRVLLVLDNFEQVLGGATSVSQLLAACPRLTVLSSSRSPLRISGEQEYPVPPLGLPDPARLPPLAHLSAFESVALFIERARAVKPDFGVTNDNAPAVAEICVRLDGLPLAIELAAARIRILSPQAMLSRLEHRLALLGSGSRDLPERQQTLRGAISWSHDMLAEPERALFASLAVFAGGAGLEAVERVSGPDVAGDVLDGLTSLVDQSLVRQLDGVGGEARFAMLETIREFALEQAALRGNVDELRMRHATHFAELVATAAEVIMGSDKRGWLDRLAEDHDNIRAALTWFTDTGRALEALLMAARLWRFWQMRGHLAEGRSRVEAAIALPGAADHPAELAGALSAAAGIAYWQGDSAARDLYTAEIELRRQLDDKPGLAEALYGISFTWSVSIRGEANLDPRLAADAIEQALAIYRELGDDLAIGRCEWALGNALYSNRDLDGAREHAQRALAIFEAADDQFMVGWSSYTLGLADLADEHLRGGGAAALAAARPRLERALRIFAAADDVSGYTLVLDAFALLALRRGDRQLAARLLAAVSGLEHSTGTGLNPWNREVLGANLDEVRNDPSLAADWAAGEQMTVEAAVALALDGPAHG